MAYIKQLGRDKAIKVLHPMLEQNGFIYDNKSIGSWEVNPDITEKSPDDTRVMTIWFDSDEGDRECVEFTISDLANAEVSGDTLYIDGTDLSILRIVPLDRLGA